MPTASLALFAADATSLSTSVVGPLAAALGLLVVLAAVGRVPLSYNVNNLRARAVPTAMTAGAFVLVTALLTAMLAFVNGMYVLTLGSGRADNLIVLSEGATDEGFSNLGFSDVGDLENQAGVARDGRRPLVSRETYLVVNQPLPNAPAGRPKRRFLQMRGIDDAGISAAVHAVELYPGGAWFSEAGVRELPAAGDAASSATAIEAVVGEGLAREMARDDSGRLSEGKPRLDVGDTFTLNGRTWILTGIMQSSGRTFDSELWAKRGLIGPLFGKETYSSLVVRAEDAATAARLKDFYNNEYKKAAVNAQIETNYYEGLNETNKQFHYAIQFLTVVMSIGGIFGVMNTMYAAVSQRTREIGVLRLLGFSRVQVLTSFLLESILIALAGGAAGCALGSLVDGTTANSIVSSGAGGGKFVVLRLVVDADTLAVGMILSLAMGLLGGLLPALSAVRLRILNALR